MGNRVTFRAIWRKFRRPVVTLVELTIGGLLPLSCTIIGLSLGTGSIATFAMRFRLLRYTKALKFCAKNLSKLQTSRPVTVVYRRRPLAP